ncbi:MAG: TonB-dependent receptor [Deferribacteres bacterium]|nr:TonB-dependent receptor [Deferribacteres bacterium]
MKRKAIIFFSLSIFICLFSIAYASTGKISGTIVDAETNEPLIGANIVIEGIWQNGEMIESNQLQGAATDKDGFYYIINLSPNRYVLKAMMIGYESKRVTNIEVGSNRRITVNFSLKPAAIAGETVTIIAEREVVKLDVSSSETVITAADAENLPVNSIEEVLNLTSGVRIDPFDNRINIRGGGSDQVTAYLDGFSMKDEIFNIPFLSFNRTSIKEISIQTGGFLAEYGNLRSGVIDVVTETGAQNYSLSVDGRYAPPGYKYWGPHKYTEDKPYLMYASPWSMDSTILHQKFPHPSDDFDGWPAYSRRRLTDKDSTNDLSPNQRRELWKWRHRGRTEGNIPDYVVDATLSGPVPFLPNLTFMLSYRNQYDAYAHPAYRDHFGLENSQFKLTYRITPAILVTMIGMNSSQSGMGIIEADGGNSAIIMRTDGGGTYADLNNPLANNKTQNWGLNFKHVLSAKTFYEVGVNHIRTEYDFHHGPERDTTLVKYIEGEYYVIPEGDTMQVSGFWDRETNNYVTLDTIFYAGDQMWMPGFWVDETPYGWPPYGAGLTEYDQVGKYDLNTGSTSTERSSGWTTYFKADLTHQLNKYNLIKTGVYYTKSRISRDWDHIISAQNDEWYSVNYAEFPQYYAGYIQDRLELDEFTANFGVRAEIFDANADVISPDDPFNDTFYELYFKTRVDSLPTARSTKYFKLSPRIGISHPLSVSSKIFFNYGHSYSSPKNSLRYGFRPKTYDWSRPLWIGNPNLAPYKTTQYELGYEQVLFTNYLIHATIYYKDVRDQAKEGHGIEYHQFGGGSQAFYYTWENNQYDDIVGMEFTLYKRFGRFFSGWARTEFMGQKEGLVGVPQKYLPGDPEAVSEFNTFSYPNDRLWDWQPGVLLNLDFHTPSQWGPEILGYSALGGWRLNAIIDWKSGGKFTWNPELDPQVYNNMQGYDHFMTDIFISRAFTRFNSKITAYVDIHNLINRDMLNIGILRGLTQDPSSEIYKYYASLKDGDRVGDFKQSYIDRPDERPGEDYITRYGGVTSVFFGLRFNFDWK